MAKHQPYQVIGYHSCDREVGLRVLNGEDTLLPSKNKWDWLGHGIYFWEQNPFRALGYAIDSSEGRQFNKTRIKTPFVLGAIIELGNCLNLIQPDSNKIIDEAYKGIEKVYKSSGTKMPVNKDNNRILDCAVIEAVHKSVAEKGGQKYDSVRCLFQEGDEIYPKASFFSQIHIQVCVRDHNFIRGYFLPLPILEYNPSFRTTQ